MSRRPSSPPSSTPSSTPRTLSAWRTYIAALSATELVTVAHDANSIVFVEALEQEGYAPEQIHAVLHAFAARLTALEVRPPMGGLYDFTTLAREPAPEADDEPGATARV